MYQSGDLDDNMVELDLDSLADITAAASGPASSSSSSNGGPAAAGHAALGSLASTIMEAMSRHGAGGPGGLQGRGKRRMKVRGAGEAAPAGVCVVWCGGVGYGALTEVVIRGGKG